MWQLRVVRSVGGQGLAGNFPGARGLKPAERIIRTLEFIAEGKLEVTDDFTPEEVLEYIKDGYASRLRDEEASKRFLSEAKKIVARWKMIEN